MKKILPVKETEFYEMRFHSIGGQGAYTTGQMIAAIGAEIEELKSAVFASYGSEKKGAPVSVFVRFLESEKSIRNYSAVKSPNLVCVFHEKLLGTIDVLDGLKENGILIVNSTLSGEELVEKYKLDIEKIIVVDATKIAINTGAKVNTVLFGTIMNSLDFLPREKGSNQIKEKLSYKYPQLVQSNIQAYEQGYEEVEKYAVTPSKEENNIQKYDLGYENQYEGGIIKGVNTYKVDRSISREGLLPEFDKEKCINCTKCDLTCPDDCFVWEEKEGRKGRMEMILQGINYNHCKGCFRCVEVCPTDALIPLIEEGNYAQAATVEKEFKKLGDE